VAGQNLLVFSFARERARSCPNWHELQLSDEIADLRLDISSPQNSASVIPIFPSAQQVRYMLEEGLRRKSVFSLLSSLCSGWLRLDPPAIIGGRMRRRVFVLLLVPLISVAAENVPPKFDAHAAPSHRRHKLQ